MSGVRTRIESLHEEVNGVCRFFSSWHNVTVHVSLLELSSVSAPITVFHEKPALIHPVCQAVWTSQFMQIHFSFSGVSQPGIRLPSSILAGGRSSYIGCGNLASAGVLFTCNRVPCAIVRKSDNFHFRDSMRTASASSWSRSRKSPSVIPWEVRASSRSPKQLSAACVPCLFVANLKRKCVDM